MEWIKCSEHLPCNEQMVIVYDGSDMFFATFYKKKDKRFKKRQGEFKIHGDDFWVGEITHWTTAPELPKEE